MAPVTVARIAAANEDMTYEIFSRLPFKQVIRFRIGCKKWMSLTSSPSFVAYHARLQRRAIPDLFIVHGSDKERCTAFTLDGVGGTASAAASLLPDPSLSSLERMLSSTFPIPPNTSSFVVRGSCNGLLFCTRLGIPFPLECRFCVVNPGTMELKEIPLPPAMSTVIKGAGIVFDPTTSPHYQVVCLGCTSFYDWGTRNILEVATYSSATGEWDFSCNSSCLLERHNCFLYGGGRGAYWNGAISWARQEEMDALAVRLAADPQWEVKVDEGFLLYFDPQRRLLNRASLPTVPRGFQRNILSFGESGGRLLLIEAHCTERRMVFYDCPQLRFDVKEMGRDWSGWSVLYRVDLTGTIENLFPEISVPYEHRVGNRLELYPLLVVPRGGGEREEAEDSEDVLLLSTPEKIVSYGLRSMTFRVVCPMVAVKEERRWQALKSWHVFPCTKTVLSP